MTTENGGNYDGSKVTKHLKQMFLNGKSVLTKRIITPLFKKGSVYYFRFKRQRWRYRGVFRFQAIKEWEMVLSVTCHSRSNLFSYRKLAKESAKIPYFVDVRCTLLLVHSTAVVVDLSQCHNVSLLAPCKPMFSFESLTAKF